MNMSDFNLGRADDDDVNKRIRKEKQRKTNKQKKKQE